MGRSRPGWCRDGGRSRPGWCRGCRRAGAGAVGFAAVAGVGHRTEAVDGAVHGELGGAEALDHIATACLAAVLEGGQDAVHRREAAFDALCGDRSPGHHAVPVQKDAGQGVGAHRGVVLAVREQGPAARDSRRVRFGMRGGRRRQRAVAPARDRALGAVGRGARGAAGSQQGAHRGQRVVGEPAGPGQVPESVGELGIGGVGVGGGADLVGDLAEEQAVAPGEGVQDGLVERGQLQGVRRREEQAGPRPPGRARPSRPCPGREPAPAQTISPAAVSSSSIAGV